MAAAFYSHACILDALHRLYVNLGRCQKCLAESLSKLLIIGIQSFLLHLEDAADQRKAIAVNTAGCDSDQGIACFDICSGNEVLLIYHTNSKACQIILIHRIEARHLSSLTTDQRCIRLETAISHTFYDGSDLLRIVFAAGNVIQEEQRFSACTGNVVYTHSHTVNTNGIMFVHDESQFQFGTYSVGSGYQGRMLHIFKFIHGKCT